MVIPPKRKRGPRSFTDTQKEKILFQQDYKCAICERRFDPRTYEFDHKKPWHAGGKTITTKGRAVCRNCHSKKTGDMRARKADKKKPEKTG